MFIKLPNTSCEDYINISRIERVNFFWDEENGLGEIIFVFNQHKDFNLNHIEFKNKEEYNKYTEYLISCLNEQLDVSLIAAIKKLDQHISKSLEDIENQIDLLGNCIQ